MEFDRSVATAILETLGGTAGAENRGVPANRPDLHGDLPGLPAALGRGLARIHATPLPSVANLTDFGAEIEQRLDAGQIDTATLPEPYDRYEASRLVSIWKSTSAPASYEHQPVPLIGGPTVERLLLTDGEVSGVSGSFGLIGDRHADLAALQHSIHHSLGPEAVFGFYEAYGRDPNIVVLDQFVLAGLLCGWIT